MEEISWALSSQLVPSAATVERKEVVVKRIDTFEVSSSRPPPHHSVHVKIYFAKMIEPL